MIALAINRYFSKMEVSDEETLINILIDKKVVKRDELKKITGFTDEKLDRMIESIDEIIAEGDVVRYGTWKERKNP
jgi:hypothetical protein